MASKCLGTPPSIIAVRLQLHALAYNLGNFLRALAATRRRAALFAVEAQRQAC